MVKDKFHWFPFEPGAWLQDPELSRCSAAARGVWIDILCLMFQSDERGVLVSCGDAWTVEETARALRGDTEVNLSSIQELLRCGVMRSRKDGALYCSRMVRERNLSETRAKVGRKGGLAKGKQTASKTSSKHPSNAVTVLSKYKSSKKGKEVRSEEIWKLWRPKKNTGKSKTAIAKALAKVDFDTLKSAVESYMASEYVTSRIGTDEEKCIPMCSTWMNGERWADEQSSGSDEFKQTLEEIAERKDQGEVPK